MPLSLSGFMPGDNADGLSRLADQLVAGFERAVEDEDDNGGVVVVIGVLRAESCKYRRDAEKAPTVEMRFTAIEAVEGPEAEQVRSMVARLKAARSGVDELPFVDETGAELPDPDNVAEPERPLRVVPPADFTDAPADDDEEGEDGPHA